MGQNFLVDPAHRGRIVAAAELAPGDAVLEIGPGPGVLTELLREQAGRVVAVELDDRLIPYLRARFAARPNVEIVHGNILHVDIAAILRAGPRRDQHAAQGSHTRAGEAGAPSVSDSELRTQNSEPRTQYPPYKVVANLPYYITGAVIPLLLEAKPAPELVVVTVQREVAERMVATPPDMSLLALGVQLYSRAEIVGRIPAAAFFPAPKVESAVVRMRLLAQPAAPGVSPAGFFRVARAGFGQRRKQLRNSLAAGLRISAAEANARLVAAGIEPTRRAETLTVEEWGMLAQQCEGN